MQFKTEEKPQIGMMDDVTSKAVAKEFAKAFLKDPSAMAQFSELYNYAKNMGDKAGLGAVTDQMYSHISEWTRNNFTFEKGLSPEQLNQFKDSMVATVASYISAYENVKQKYDQLPEHLSGMFLRNYLEKEARKEIGSDESLVSAVANHLREEIKPQADKFLAQEKQRQELERKRKKWSVTKFKYVPAERAEGDKLTLGLTRGDGTTASVRVEFHHRASSEEIIASMQKALGKAVFKVEGEKTKGIAVSQEHLRLLSEQIIRQREQERIAMRGY